MNDLDSESNTLNPDEFRLKVDSLQDADWIRLRKIASIHAAKCNADWEDILNEALVRALDGRRKCKKDLSVIVFLDGAMRSIVNSWNKASKTTPTANAAQLYTDTDEGQELTIDHPPDNSTPDMIMEAQEMLDKFEALFEGDDEALMVLMGQQDDLPPDEIQELTGLDKTQYATVLRRIRRRFEKLVATGEKK